MTIPAKVDVLVVGAGISGLAAAHWLRKRGRSVLVLERDATVGGTMKSVREKGFLSETGPNSALETTPLLRELAMECGLLESWQYANPAGKNRFILRNGRMIALPLGPGDFLRTSLFSWSAKVRLLAEPFIGRAEREESIAEFVTRRLGREFLDYAIDPFVAGVYAARPERLSVRAAFPKLYALEAKYGGLIRGMIGGARERRKRAEKAKDRAESFSFANGMQELPTALARGLGKAVFTRAEVKELRRARSNYVVRVSIGGRVRELRARAVVLATPAHVAAHLIEQLSPDVSGALRAIEYAPVVSLFAGYRTEDIGERVDGFGVLIPSVEQRTILGALFSSSLFPGRAPEGMAAFTLFIGGGRQPELLEAPDSVVKARSVDELARIMQIRGKPVYSRLTRWSKAIPQYTLGYSVVLDRLKKSEAELPGLAFCSNYVGGIAVGDCVMSARRTADRIDKFLADG